MDAAVGFASALLQLLIDRVAGSTFDEIRLAAHFNDDEELRRLISCLQKTQFLLSDEDQDLHYSNRAWQLCLAEVKRVCYDADDLMDEIALNMRRPKPDALTDLVRDSVISSFRKWTVPRKVRDLQSQLEDIEKEMSSLSKMKKRTKLGIPQAEESAERPSNGCLLSIYRAEDTCGVGSSAQVFSKKIFGREIDKENLIVLLQNETCVSIVGIDGLGKTTLAQAVLSDPRIHARFDPIVWVQVSADFASGKVANSILNKFADQDMLQQLQEGKRFLIVLDDVWDVKLSDWQIFRSDILKFFTCKILVTTRNPRVGSVIKATPYYMRGISTEDCNSLILDRALSYGNTLSLRRKEILSEVAATMAQKCEGLPAAANIVGLVLAMKDDDDEWVTLQDKDLWDLKEFKEEVFPSFRLNYSELAASQKNCLAYCSLFPSHYDHKKNNLIQMWIAEGFILPHERMSLEEIGNEYFDELLSRSILQQSETLDPQAFKMHEFIQRFARFVSSDTHLRCGQGMANASSSSHKDARHLSFICKILPTNVLEAAQKCEGLRTFLLLHEHGTQIGKVPYSLFQKLGRLRVLNLSHSDIIELPDSICNLKHLRYLDMSRTRIRKLPETTSNLCALQILKLQDCPQLLQLPKGLQNLTNLLHLELDMGRLRRIPANIGKLSSLRTLGSFRVGKSEGQKISELQNLKQLRGSVSITNLEHVENQQEAREAMLCDKPNLKRLELKWNGSGDRLTAAEVLAGLQPHRNLKELQVTKYIGLQFPSWLSSPSCMLVSAQLKNCSSCEVLPRLGALPYLKHLRISGMRNVKCVDHQFYGEDSEARFVSLESLQVCDMPSLEQWKGPTRKHMPRLHNLEIVDCPKLTILPSLHCLASLHTLQLSRCGQLKSMPDEGLPSSLTSISIVHCDLLKEQCQAGKGVDWWKIKDIPLVEIDFVKIQTTRQDA